MKISIFTICYLIFVLIIESSGTPANREESSGNLQQEEKVIEEVPLCSELTACKWGVFNGKTDPHKRIVQEVVNKKCRCGEHRQCVRREESLSKGAWIFRCREINKTEN